MGLRDRMKGLERASRDHLTWFVLESGERYYLDSREAWVTGFRHTMSCLDAQAEGVPFPEPPEIYRKIAQAQDRRKALGVLGGKSSFTMLPYELDPLLERGELVERSMVVGHDLGEGPILDCSE